MSRPGQILLTAAVYWLAGRLALLMAIPPGYATAVWPAAGFAPVAVLLWGPRVAAGIVLGSFFVNVGTSFDSSSSAAIARSVAVAVAIGLGAALQGVAGAAGIRRFVGFPNPLERERDIALLPVLAGPIASVVSSTVGVSTLCAAGIVPWTSFAFSWWTWWVGDTIGVLIFTPAILLFVPGPHVVTRRRRALVGLPLGLGFAIVVLLFLRASAWEAARLRTDFERRALTLARTVEAQFSAYQQVVEFVASLFDASTVSREEFREFSRRALEHYPAIRGIGWNPVVPHAARAGYEAAAQRDGIPGFAFTEHDAGGRIRRAGTRPEYVPAYYLEPREGNTRALGYDVASDSVRRTALAGARTSGAITATPPLTLVQDEGPGASGVLLVAPVFAGPPAEPGAARTVRGYAVGVFRIRDGVEAALARLDHAGLDVLLLDQAAGDQPLYATGDGVTAAATRAEEASSETSWRSAGFTFGGRPWSVEVRATAAGLQRSWQAWIVLAGGMFFVGLLGVVMLVSTGRASLVQQVLEERTRVAARAIQAREQFRLTLEALPTGMLVVNPRGAIVLVNAHLERLLGYAREEMVGRPIEMLVPERFRTRHPTYRQGFSADPRARPMGSGRDLYALRKDGTEVPVEIGLNPLRTADGEFVMSSVVDITERKRAERDKEGLLSQLRALNADLEDRVQVRTRELSATLKEREVLLQEIHHRVKNNLQVISSLINLQVRRLDNGASREALEECRTRVQAIALVHEKLYQSRDYSRVPFAEYAKGLAVSAFQAASVTPESVSLDVALDDLPLAVDRAIPCGLILNELITNALKHAFPAGRGGTVRIEFHPERRQPGRLVLAVSDDGVGIPADFDIRQSNSLGMQLVCALAEQLDAHLEVRRENGTSFRLAFAAEE